MNEGVIDTINSGANEALRRKQYEQEYKALSSELSAELARLDRQIKRQEEFEESIREIGEKIKNTWKKMEELFGRTSRY